MKPVKVDSYDIAITNRDKILFPGQGITKGHLIDYYRRIGRTMIPLIFDRPITMHRFPNGIQGEGFFQQEMPDYFPSWLERINIRKKEGGTITRILCGKTADLVYLANQGCITPHAWLKKKIPGEMWIKMPYFSPNSGQFPVGPAEKQNLYRRQVT